MLKKIISGGQTGADQGALHGARLAGLETGGTAPREWRTEDGPSEELLKHYNLVELQNSSYAERTKKNVLDSDATVLFGNIKSSGSAFTLNFCAIRGKGCFKVSYPSSTAFEDVKLLAAWLRSWRVEVLNVAGNRESKNPGIHVATKLFVIALVEELEKEQKP